MEKVSIVLFAVSIIGFLVGDGYIGHIWGLLFFNTSVLFSLSYIIKDLSLGLSEPEAFFVYICLSLYLLAGIFILKYKFTNPNIDEMQK
jgi:hypothetical protein